MRRKLSHMQIIALGFFLMIITGTILLMLPISNQERVWTPFVDALFTATSASCVTGQVVRDTATYWSSFGHVVIITLIQIGGLGFMTIATLFFLACRKRMGLRKRAVMVESISYSQVAGILPFVKKIILGTMMFEGIGAVLLSIRFIPQFGLGRGIAYSVFHSISAFCNAGFDLMGIREPYISFCDYSGDWLVSLTIMFLVVMGGLGFMVWDDLLQKKHHVRRYSLHTKIVLTMSGVLLFGGAALFFLFERNNLGAEMSLHEQILTALFDSVTARTAGFNTTDTAALTDSSKLLTMMLMFIGGNSGSTAGGIKTTTVAVILIYTVCGLKGHQHATVFGRRLEEDSLKKATYVFFANLLLVLGGTLVICTIQNIGVVDVLFECFSAGGTVGMTTGITRDLNTVSKLVIIFLMYCGRVGSISFGSALLEKRALPPVTAPTEQITIG
ncbi:MAG: Trk family potassium uptake protein [Lachnospiraceae bacterium]|nr:Trk family potassium uptake protein [Lachnospiraceae bacterium]